MSKINDRYEEVRAQARALGGDLVLVRMPGPIARRKIVTVDLIALGDPDASLAEQIETTADAIALVEAHRVYGQ